MATKKRKMEIVIAGDPKGGVAAFGALSDSADTFGGKLGKMSLAAGAAFAAVGAAAGVALVKIGSDFQQGFRDIQVATGATGEALEALKADAKAVMSEVPDSFETVAQGIGILNTAFGESGEALQALSVQAIDASRILKEDAGANMKGLGKVANQFGLDAQGAGVLLDDLFKVTQDFGVGLGPLQEQLRQYGPIFQNIGFDASETSVIMGQFSKAGIDIARVSPALNKFSRDVAAVGGDPMTALLDVTQAINDAASTTDALNIASDAFGAEGAQRMVTAVRDAGVGFEDLQDVLAGSEGGIAKAAEQTATLGEKWREFTNKVLVQLEPVATRAFGFVMDAMDRMPALIAPVGEAFDAHVIPAIEKVGDVFTRRLVPVMQRRVWPAVKRLSAIVSEFGDKFADLAQWVRSNQPVLIGLSVAVGVGLVSAFTAWAVSATAAAVATIAAMAPVIAIGAAIAGLTAAVVYAYQNWDWFRDSVDAVWVFIKDVAWPGLVGFASWFAEFAVGVADKAVAIYDGVRGAFSDLVGFVSGLPSAISSAASGMFDGIKDAFRSALNFVIDAWNGLEFTIPTIEVFGASVGGQTIGVPDIPRLHDGGMFRTSNPSGEGLAMLQDGERVLSRSEVAAPGRKQTLELNLRLNGRDLQKILLEGDARGFRMAV